jgi:hypothetical protein
MLNPLRWFCFLFLTARKKYGTLRIFFSVLLMIWQYCDHVMDKRKPCCLIFSLTVYKKKQRSFSFFHIKVHSYQRKRNALKGGGVRDVHVVSHYSTNRYKCFFVWMICFHWRDRTSEGYVYVNGKYRLFSKEDYQL